MPVERGDRWSLQNALTCLVIHCQPIGNNTTVIGKTNNTKFKYSKYELETLCDTQRESKRASVCVYACARCMRVYQL